LTVTKYFNRFLLRLTSFAPLGTDRVENTVSNSTYSVACVSVAAGNVFTEPFPSSGRLFLLINICCPTANVVSLSASQTQILFNNAQFTDRHCGLVARRYIARQHIREKTPMDWLESGVF
jgi:hypothetical protein